MDGFSRPDGLAHPVRASRHAGDDALFAASRVSPAEACASVGSSPNGLSYDEAELRLHDDGPNLVTREHRATIPRELWGRARNPLNALLLTLAIVSYFLGDARACVVIVAMVVLAIATAFIQEHRSNQAAARLRAMVHTTASVRRQPPQSAAPFGEIPMERLVPGDIVRLSAGDMMPADLRLLEAKDLFVNQSALTGESMPVGEDRRAARRATRQTRSSCRNLCFMGTNVVSAARATASSSRTGARHLLRRSSPTSSSANAPRRASTRASTASPG